MSSTLLESIHIQDGKPQNISYHNTRFNSARAVFWPNLPVVNLQDIINVPDEYKIGKVKCRVLYQAEIESIEFQIYQPKLVERLKLVTTNIEYSNKWADRSKINALLAESPFYDDILMVKDGLVTDTSYANIIFKKDNEFFTPKSPMLNGTKRQYLIEEEILTEKIIRPSDVKKYSHFALINAMNDLDLTKFLPTKNIFK